MENRQFNRGDIVPDDLWWGNNGKVKFGADVQAEWSGANVYLSPLMPLVPGECVIWVGQGACGELSSQVVIKAYPD